MEKQNSSRPLVSVICTAYNHERYIRQCLESLVNQKTDFAYEIIVHDDASTDNTAAIIREFEELYPDKIVPIYQKENQYSKGVNSVLKHINPKVRGKYTAICEGDDFWTSENKLQKQFDFMESHPDYSLCAHSAYYAVEDGTLETDHFHRMYEGDQTVSTETILKNNWSFATNSLFCRFSEDFLEPIPFQENCVNGDQAFTIFSALKGKVYYFDELMSAYRRISVGSINDKWRKNPQIFIDNEKEFIRMLERIDKYSDGKYHRILAKREFFINIYITQYELKWVKKDKKRVNMLFREKPLIFLMAGWMLCYMGIFDFFKNIVLKMRKENG